MNDDVQDIAAYYNRDPQKEHTRLERHPLEYDLTWRYLRRCLPPGCAVLEVGAATGRYTVELARRGYQVTAVDMSAALLEECGRNLQAAGLADSVTLAIADARDLGALPRQDYDAVLLMGPLYHLVELPDRQLASRQAWQHLRPGGLIFSAFISRFGLLGDLMRNVPGWIDEQAEVQSVLTLGRDPLDYPRGGFRGYFAHPQEIAPLHEEAGFETLALAAVEPAISAHDESYNDLQEPWRSRWLDVLEQISTEPSILGASRHLLYIGRKMGD